MEGTLSLSCYRLYENQISDSLEPKVAISRLTRDYPSVRLLLSVFLQPILDVGGADGQITVNGIMGK
jgi:hypothetical protein